MTWFKIKGVVVRGHGVASGRSADPRFPHGTIAMQKPLFRQLGLDLDQYHSATVNLSIAPYTYEIKNAKCTFRNVKWAPTVPPEDFSFFDCRIMDDRGQAQEGLVYYPHPETKPEHFQASDVLELITVYIENLTYGDEMIIELLSEQIIFERHGFDSNLNERRRTIKRTSNP